MRMTERQQILILVAITLLVGVLAVAGAAALPELFREDLEVQHYDAVFYENGTLVERYTYLVRSAGEYRMLFRYWDAPLTFAPIDQPHIEFIGMTAPPGTIGYVKNAGGRGADGRRDREFLRSRGNPEPCVCKRSGPLQPRLLRPGHLHG